jgi:nicotinic acid mononucleotide adenylyltransferase
MELHWKIKRDKYYSELIKNHIFSFIEKAGFFYDTDAVDRNIDESVPFYCTPLNKLQNNLKEKSDKNPIVLLTAGSFNPMHSGHLEMMEVAKENMEKKGYSVVGGFISLGHDEYIKEKSKEKWLPINERIRIAGKFIKNSNWLEIDPWEAIYNKVAINFTDVIYRLEKYLQHFLGQSLDIFFVLGGDNARFMDTFLLKGNCIVIERGSSNSAWMLYDRIVKYEKEYPDFHKRVHIFHNDNQNSSTKIRDKKGVFVQKNKKVNIRTSGDKFYELKVFRILERYFKETKVIYIKNQQAFLDQTKLSKKIISLDKEIKTGNNIDISRMYDINGQTLIGFDTEDENSIEDQIQKINIKNCILFDDDSASCKTIDFITRKLNDNRISVDAFFLLNKTTDDCEILDAKDFIICAEELYNRKDSGLLLNLLGTKIKLPYVLPFVNPYLRGSILDSLEFSLDIWGLNMEFWKNKKVFIKDTKLLSIIKFYKGLEPDFTVFDFCYFMYCKLKMYK